MDENIRLKKSVGELSALATANARQALRRQVNMQTLTITQVSCSCILSKFSNNFYPMQLFQNDEAIKHYTQFPSFAALKTFYDGLPKPARTQARTLSQLNEFVLTLMKLRRNLSFFDLGVRFGVSHSTAARIFWEWIHCLDAFYSDIQPALFVSKDGITRTLPPSFSTHPTFRHVTGILDATEFFCERPADKSLNSAMFSSYKHHTTMKALVCITPSGALSFVSDLFTGNTSDLELVQRSGILNYFNQGDALMVDRGVNILEECQRRGLTLLMPSFLNKRPQFTEDEVSESRQVRDT